MKKTKQFTLLLLGLPAFAVWSGCGPKNNPKPKLEVTNVDGYWKDFLFTSYIDSAALLLRSGHINIYVAYQQAIDTTKMKPTWTGTYSLKGDSIFFTMAPDVYGKVQRGKGIYELPFNQYPGTMEINYYYTDTNGTGLYEMIKQ